MTVKLPYIDWRDGRPRFNPNARIMDLGYAGEELKHADGRWYTYEEARAFSEVRMKEIEAKKAKPGRARVKQTPQSLRPLSDLLHDWSTVGMKSIRSEATRESHRKNINAIIYRPETRGEAKERRARERALKLLGQPVPERAREPIADTPPRLIGKPELRNLHEYWSSARGLHSANALIATLSCALAWGCESTTWRLAGNPRTGMEFDKPLGRICIVPMPAFLAIVRAADAIGRSSIGDAAYLALFTGQRQGDRLQMLWSGEDGRLAFRQNKTGMLVDMKEAAQLSQRLKEAWKRVAALKLRLGLQDMPAQIVISEETGKPYDDDTYRHWFAVARELALHGSKEHGLQPCPDIVQKVMATELNEKGERVTVERDTLVTDQDFRDTCVTLLDRAGCDLLTICDITGHSYQSAQTIIRHYRARNAARADEGIDRLVVQVRKEGLAG